MNTDKLKDLIGSICACAHLQRDYARIFDLADEAMDIINAQLPQGTPVQPSIHGISNEALRNYLITTLNEIRRCPYKDKRAFGQIMGMIDEALRHVPVKLSAQPDEKQPSLTEVLEEAAKLVTTNFTGVYGEKCATAIRALQSTAPAKEGKQAVQPVLDGRKIYQEGK